MRHNLLQGAVAAPKSATVLFDSGGFLLHFPSSAAYNDSNFSRVEFLQISLREPGVI